MRARLQLGIFLVFGPGAAAMLAAEQRVAPLPDVRQLMNEVQEHQKQVDKIRESYTFSSTQTTQDLDAKGNVTKTETEDHEVFFVNGHAIQRTVKKNGKPLNEHDDKKETERVTKLVQRAEKTPRDQTLEGQSISISRILEIMDVSAPRRETFRNRPMIVFDFVGRKNAKTHGMMEDASKKLKGTLWVDEADREVAHMEVTFIDSFKIGGGLVASLQKGTSFRFDQEPVESGFWLPTGAEASLAARVLLLKGVRQHMVERDYDYKKFHVDTQQVKDAKVVQPSR